jgi:hypothetical protein
VLRVGLGLAELAVPDRLGAAALGHRPDERERVVMRALGARQIGQQVAAERGHDLLGGPVADVLHAASMLPVAVVSRRYRRSALTSAAIAAALAVLAA